MERGHIKIFGPFPPPSGVVGPFARKTESHVYQIFDKNGRKVIGGTYGADTGGCIARARHLAAEKGLIEPTIERVAG